MQAIVFDMRGYPQGTAWTIAPRLTSKKNVPAAKFTRKEVNYPVITNTESDENNVETWSTFIQNIPNPTDKWQYKGKTVMLINEDTQSQAEHTGLFFKAANNTQFIGSQTAGANGDVTNFVVPGGLTLNFSGQTVWFPNGKQLQRTGLVPDILVKPTIKGIQAGKDEVLARAILYLETGK
jgi:C-terminal processing protease CtpA/Prc